MNGTILVIEDNDLNRELVTDLLQSRGYDVLPACEAEEGLKLAVQHLPTLILMDLSLPHMDGLAATRALRANKLTAHLTIIALTAHAMKGDEQIALDAGCNGYLTKPIDTRTFISQLEKFIQLDHTQITSPQ
jgi:CheY-like chemotaxis protein